MTRRPMTRERATACRSSSPAWIVPTRCASAWSPCAATAAGTRSRSWWSTTIPASGLTASVLDEHPNVVRVTEPRRGLAYARNAGFLAASGEILVTTDDDVQVPEGWLDLLLDAIPAQRRHGRVRQRPADRAASPGAGRVRGHGRSRQGVRPSREPLGEPSARHGVPSGRGTWAPPRTPRSERSS